MTTTTAGQPSPTDTRSSLLQAWQDSLRQVLAAFDEISLAQTTSVNLLDRMDIKYVMPQTQLPTILSELPDHYRVLVIGGRPISHYRTLYFDTGDLAMYRRHHAGADNRYKVRAREYVDSGAAFLEVKHRMGARHTVKKRIRTDELQLTITPRALDFLANACPYPPAELQPSLWNYFARITLVSKQRPERVTLDVNLAYARQDAWAELPGIIVAEVKYQGARCASAFVAAMHRHNVHSTGFSKYCMGVSLLYPDIKHNSIKAKQRLVARMQGANNDLP